MRSDAESPCFGTLQNAVKYLLRLQAITGGSTSYARTTSSLRTASARTIRVATAVGLSTEYRCLSQYFLSINVNNTVLHAPGNYSLSGNALSVR